MRLQELDSSLQAEMRAIVKSVDKKLHLSLQDGPSGQDPLVSLTITHPALQHGVVSMDVSVEELQRAVDNARERWVLRERVKRARLRLMCPEETTRFFDTTAIRPGSESYSNFRGGRR